jgi:CheY-like chemotaxis protein
MKAICFEVRGVHRTEREAGRVVVDNAMVDTESVRILIVNDVIATRELLWDLLEFQGHKVAFATAGEVALERLKTGQYDVLFLDPSLPDMSGWDVLRLAREQHPAMCIILLATEYNHVSASDVMRTGADGYLVDLPAEEDGVTQPDGDLGEVLSTVLWRSLERRRLLVESERLQEEVDAHRQEAGAARQELEQLRDKIAQTERDMDLLRKANAASAELIQPLKVLIGRIDLLMQESVLDGQLIEEMIGLRRQAVHMSPIVHRMGQISGDRAMPWFPNAGTPRLMQGERNWG